METVRDIAIIVLVVQALVIWFAVLICAIFFTVFIIETTVTVRRFLLRTTAQARKVGGQVDQVIDKQILSPLVRYERGRAYLTSFLENIRSGLEDIRDSAKPTDSSSDDVASHQC